MISAWWLLPMVASVLISCLWAASAHRDAVERARFESYFEGIKKGHQDMQKRFTQLIKEKGKGK